jgi:mono/diheme cytochrome c family protein
MAKRKKKKAPPKKVRRSKKPALAVGAIVLVVLGFVVAQYLRKDFAAPKATAVVSDDAMQGSSGKVAFATHCAECHGTNATGTDKGPPLVHRYYVPSHHADFSFVQAVRQGVRQHHWRFGNMPPQPGVSQEEINLIIGYVRELQRANGIF